MIDIQHLQKDNRDLIIVTLKGRLTAEEYDVFLPPKPGLDPILPICKRIAGASTASRILR